MDSPQKILENNSVADKLALLGIGSMLGFLAVFLNIPWEWSMFMDDTLYNTWMPQVSNIGNAIQEEIRAYWELGRFYPVKYLANLLKWRYLPNDPYIFRYFNFSVFLLSAFFGSLAALRASMPTQKKYLWPLLIFLVGSSVLHKPLLEIISLNPIGETWVCFFFSLGAFLLFSPRSFHRSLAARLMFILAAMSKEPFALVFFASACRYGYLAYKADSRERRAYLLQALLDLIFFAFFLGLALKVMAQGSFTKGAYFSSTPWLLYSRDFLYKTARYAFWTSPFIALFIICSRELWKLLRENTFHFTGAAIFFFTLGISYLGFMSTQGRVAYQEIPASFALYCLFSLFAASLFWSGNLSLTAQKYGKFLVLLFAVSFLVSVTRWERFVRGFTEPRRALVNLLSTGEQMTLLIPVGEIYGHVQTLIKDINPNARVFQIDDSLSKNKEKFQGKAYVFDFPFYMGGLNPKTLAELEELVGPWFSIVDANSYRIYVPVRSFSSLGKDKISAPSKSTRSEP